MNGIVIDCGFYFAWIPTHTKEGTQITHLHMMKLNKHIESRLTSTESLLQIFTFLHDSKETKFERLVKLPSERDLSVI